MPRGNRGLVGALLRLDYRIPSAPLRSSLTVHALVSGVEQRTIDSLPAMLPNLHIRLNGGSSYIFGDGAAVAAPRATLVGPTNAAYRMVLEPGLAILATGFLPAGWMRLLRFSALDARDRIIDGEDLWGRTHVDRLCERLLAEASEDGRLAILEAFLLERLGGADEGRRASIAAIDHWLEHSPRLDLDDLEDLLGVGARHMRRLTLDAHGASPRMLAMKYRSLRAAARLAVDGRAGIDEALAHFADQAHLIRNFRRFVGWTPGAFLRERRSVAAGTLIGRSRAGTIRPLALWS